MSTRWRLDQRVQGLVEEKPAYWNWLEKHRNIGEVKRRSAEMVPWRWRVAP